MRTWPGDVCRRSVCSVDEPRDWRDWRRKVAKDRAAQRDYASDRHGVNVCRATIGQASTSVCVLTLY